MLKFVLEKTGWNAVFFLFLVLFGMYGYSVPISVFFNLDIGWHRVAKLSTWQKVDESLFSFLISNQLAMLGILVTVLLFVKRKFLELPIAKDGNVGKSYLQLAIIAGFLSSFSEGLNFFRVGGLSAIANGKAFYQGAVNDLVLNVPYEGFFFISVGLFGIYIKSVGPGLMSKIQKSLVYLMSIAFVLWVNIKIGERGMLVVAIVILLLAYTIGIRIKKVKGPLILGGVVLYVIFNSLTLLRENDVKYKGIFNFIDNYGERLVRLMNPANTEFGASALNYRIYIDKRPDDFTYKLGTTYAEILWAFFPTYVYPNKPKSIIYEFRDTYFPERKKLGSTAGTGFSSLMEAHMNFGYFGPFITYLIASLFLIAFEIRRKRSDFLSKILYLLLFNIYLIYSRSASQYILATLVFYIVQLLMVWITYRLVPKTFFKYLNLNED